MKKFLILLLSLFLAFSFVSCDNGTPAPGTGTESGGGETGGDTPAVTEPEWIVIPAPDKGEMGEETKNTVMYTMTTFMNALRDQLNNQPYDDNTVGAGYDNGDKIIFIYNYLTYGSREYTLNTAGEIIKLGDKIVVDPPDSSLLNGKPMTEDENDDFKAILDKAYSYREKTTSLFKYDPVNVGDSPYNVTMKMVVSKKLDKNSTATETITACTYSLDKPYGDGEIKEITIYGNGDFSDGNGIPTGNVVCEIEGSENISGIYRTTLTLK